MKDRIKTLFDKYRKNYIDWKEDEKALTSFSHKEEWLKTFREVEEDFYRIYVENKEVIEKLKAIFEDGLSDEAAEAIYDEAFYMYTNDYNDAEFLIFIYKKLIAFYEEKSDYNRLANLYTCIQNYYLDVDNPAASMERFDVYNVKKAMSFKEHYCELTPLAREKIWISFYTYVIRYLDYRIISLKESLDAYEEIMEFSEREDVKKLDENIERIQALKEYMKQTLFIGINQIDSADRETRKRFHEYTKDLFKTFTGDLKSLYELPSEQYACYIYNEYFENNLDINTILSMYLDYFAFKFNVMRSKGNFELDDIIQCTNAVEYISRLGKRATDSNLMIKTMGMLVDVVQAQWIKGNIEHQDSINELLSRVCLYLLSYDNVGIEKEKCITQLVVMRDVRLYIDTRVTTDVAIALYRELSFKKPDFFNTVEGIEKAEWRDYLYYGSMFHDIGEQKIVGCLTAFNRPRFEEEAERNKKHLQFAVERFESFPSMSKYVDLIAGHHAYFNGEGGYSYNYDRAKSKVAPFVDIIALASYIEEVTNPYKNFDERTYDIDLLVKELEKERNRRFNGELIDLLMDSKTLQNDIEKIVTEGRDSTIYEVYHNWEQIQLSQDEKTILDEINEKMLAFRDTMDTNPEPFKPYLQRLEYMARNTENDEIRGCCCYYLMRYYFIIRDYVKAFSIEKETNELLMLTRNNKLLVRNYINCGNAEMIRDNLDSAMSKYLSAYDLARKTPECEMEMNLTLVSIANIYLKSFHYAKAIEYYKLANDSFFSEEDQLRFICMEGYCYAKINDRDKVREMKESVDLLFNEHEELRNFAPYVYQAIHCYSLGLDSEMRNYLKLIRQNRVNEDVFIYLFDEVLFYLELLQTIGDYDNALEELDYYLSLCEKNENLKKGNIQLLEIRLHVQALKDNNEEALKYQSAIGKLLEETYNEQANHMEEMEETFKHSIELQREYFEYINSKEKMERSVQKAKSDSEHKSQFLSSMSHEIRTPINAILGLNEMILRECKDEEILQYSADIRNAGKQLLGIINDVLDYSKIEAGKMEIVAQKYNLAEMVNDIKNMIIPKMQEKNLNFVVNVNSDIPNVLYGDDLRIKQILLNLLSNAYKYTKEGDVQFSIDYHKENEQSIRMKFSVKDSGIGLKPEEINKLASPFERFDHVKNRGVEGTGLGMSIVVKLLEQMGSKLKIESEYGKGSEFSFELIQPVLDWGDSVGKLDEVRKKVFQNTIKNPGTKKLYAPKAKVLVVDDNAVNLKVMQALLKRTGVQVTAASGGQECLDYCRDTSFNIIMLDHMMPEMDGIETLHRLKEMGGLNENTPVIALTANVVESADDFYKKEGFDELLGKPVNAEKMEEMLAFFLPSFLQE